MGGRGSKSGLASGSAGGPGIGGPSVGGSESSTGSNSLAEFQKMDDNQLSAFMNDLPDYRSLRNMGLNDNELQQVVHKLGLHDKPVVLDNATWDAKVKSDALDGVYLWRGVDGRNGMTAEDIHNHLKFADVSYMGGGIHGDGIYFTTKFGYAESYSDFTSNSIMKAYIDKNKANVITEGKLRDMQSKESGVKSNLDLSTYALQKGYNVIHCPGGNSTHQGTVNHYNSYKNGGQDFYVVLDRKTLVIRDTSK